MKNKLLTFFTLIGISLLPILTFASGSDAELLNLHATHSMQGIICVAVFTLAYILVMLEEVTELRKSKPVVLASGVIWVIVAFMAGQQGLTDQNTAVLRHYVLEFSELFLFLLCAMTYINAMEERLVFESLRVWLVQKGFSYKQLFWVTGWMSFFISPIADNLTTALLMCAVILAVGKDNKKFVSISCINIVVAANAGGAFSPFGDITTLMVWQKGILSFFDFFQIFIPSCVSYVVPAAIMYCALDNEKPKPSSEVIKTRPGAKRIILLFLMTITITVLLHNFLHIPPAVGMMTGMSCFMFFSFYLKRYEEKKMHADYDDYLPFDIFNKVKRAEWDTLFFFYGVILSVGGLAVMGYLSIISQYMYTDLGKTFSAAHAATPANVIVGVLSAIIDNIPVMFSVLTMQPEMSEGQWLLATLTAGIGGSMLSIGSAAGVALMGQARGTYTFMSHMKWSWAIMLGYILAVLTHIWVNNALFYLPIVQH